MAKAISQDTFNEVVKENIEEFDMTEDEAVQDAVKQFEAQGVNLSNIIKNPGKALRVKSAVDKVLNLANCEKLENNVVLPILREFRTSIKSEISHQLLAASMGVYPVLIKCLKEPDHEVICESLEALIALMDGFPDLLDAEGADLLLKCLLKEQQIAELALKWIEASVRKHESNRSNLIRNNVAKKLSSLSQNCNDDDKIISGVCAAIQVLILDDDVRAVVGDAHEHARTLATELLPLLTSKLSKFTTDVEVAGKLLDAISCLLIRNEFCIAFHEHQGVKFVLDAMIAHPNDEKVARSGLLVLKSLAGSDEVREAIVTSGGAPVVVNTIEKHFKNCNLAVAGCMCIGALSLRSPVNSMEIAAAGGSETLIRCLEHWKTNKTIMKHGCSAIRNQVSRCPELREEYKNLQLEHLLTEANKLHGDLGFEAKSVLLDLGCEIKLNEEWKGTGKTLDS